MGPGVLADRAAHWPEWRLPAPLQRPSARAGHQDLTYPDWMAGRWQVRSDGLDYEVRFSTGPGGEVVGDRAFNATAIGRALLGAALLQVRNDPSNPNRQIALLAGDQQLESTVVGRRSEPPNSSGFWADELALQVIHGRGDPRVSRVETLSHYSQNTDGTVTIEQWQASYPSPALGLAAAASSSGHFHLALTQLSPFQPPAQSDPAS